MLIQNDKIKKYRSHDNFLISNVQVEFDRCEQQQRTEAGIIKFGLGCRGASPQAGNCRSHKHASAQQTSKFCIIKKTLLYIMKHFDILKMYKKLKFHMKMKKSERTCSLIPTWVDKLATFQGIVAESAKSDDFIRLNVGGQRFMLRKDTIRHRGVGEKPVVKENLTRKLRSTVVVDQCWTGQQNEISWRVFYIHKRVLFGTIASSVQCCLSVLHEW